MRDATLADARALVRGCVFEDDAADVLGMMADIWPLRVADDALHLATLDVDRILVVRGDLTVDGLVADVPSDHGAMLVVLGNLTCRDLIFHGPLIVTGDLSVQRTAFFASSGDWALMVGGTARGELLVEYDHAIDIRGGAQWTHAYRRGQDPSTVIVDELLYTDGKRHFIDPAPTEDAIRGGRTILRAR